MDRNGLLGWLRVLEVTSLSARRAWIEIATSLLVYLALIVALRKESVDRNTIITQTNTKIIVALRKESVDRNVLWVL